MVRLPNWAALDMSEANTLAHRRVPISVLLLGPYNAGKTSLALTVYETLTTDQQSEVQYIESRTLVGFEERAFLTRARSGQTVAAPAHTNAREPAQFLHVRLKDRTGVPRDLLISDWSGESIDRIRDSQALSSGLPALETADRIALVVDGELLVSPLTSGLAASQLDLLCRLLAEAERLPLTVVVEIHVTKWDLVAADEADVVLAMMAEMRERALQILRLRVARIELRQSSRQWSATQPIRDLIAAWLIPAAAGEPVQQHSPPSGTRRIDRFTAWKQVQ